MISMTSGILLLYGIAILVLFMVVNHKKEEVGLDVGRVEKLIDGRINRFLPIDTTTLEALSAKQAEMERRLNNTRPNHLQAIEQLRKNQEVVEDRLDEECEHNDSRFGDLARQLDALYRALPKKVAGKKKGKRNA